MGNATGSLNPFGYDDSSSSFDGNDTHPNKASKSSSSSSSSQVQPSRLNLVCGSLGDTLDVATHARTACIQLPKDRVDEIDERTKGGGSKTKRGSNINSDGNISINSNENSDRGRRSEAGMVLARALLKGQHKQQYPSSYSKQKKDQQQQDSAHRTPQRQSTSNAKSYHTPTNSGTNQNVNKGNGNVHPSVVASPSTNSKSPHPLSEHRAQLHTSRSKYKHSSNTLTIGLSLSRRHSNVGHPDTVTRQTAFDFNELQDRAYKYVSSTDASGWRAGGGERGANDSNTTPVNASQNKDNMNSSANTSHKVAAPDTVHIPILSIECEDGNAVEYVIRAIARGEVLIPHMSVTPEALSVNGISPPDLIVRFGCERNDDVPPDQWSNWCLEFIHNQLYELFANTHGCNAIWTLRPFHLVMAKKVRWRTVKHMNQFFAHSEKVIAAWREKGPQHLDPQLSYIEGGATPEEVAKPHGIYLLRDGHPTNYFPPNLEPPYTSKMSRSLLMNVLNKSWDRKKRDWSSESMGMGIPLGRVALDLANPGGIFSGFCGRVDDTIASPTNNKYHPTTNYDAYANNNFNQNQQNKPSGFQRVEENGKSRNGRVSLENDVDNEVSISIDTPNELGVDKEIKLRRFEAANMDLQLREEEIEHDKKTYDNMDILSDDTSDHVNIIHSPHGSESGLSQLSEIASSIKLRGITEHSYSTGGRSTPNSISDAEKRLSHDREGQRSLSSSIGNSETRKVKDSSLPHSEDFLSEDESKGKEARTDEVRSDTSSSYADRDIGSKSTTNLSVTASNTTIGTSNMEKIRTKAIENVKKHASYVSNRKAEIHFLLFLI